MITAPETKKIDEPLSNLAFNFNLSRYIKGVSWDKGKGRWRAVCKGRFLGCHATHEAAARAYNIEAERIELGDLNVIPPDEDGIVPVQRRASTSQFEGFSWVKVGQCRLPISKPELKARLVSALETKM